MMSESNHASYFDDNLVRWLREHGKKIKKYELIQLVKRYLACSELEVDQSLERLIESGRVKKTDSDEYLLTDY